MRFDQIAASIIGFVVGYIGFPLVFICIGPIVEKVPKVKNISLPISKWFTAITAYLFLTLLQMGIWGVWLDILAKNDKAVRVALGALSRRWMVLGLIFYGLIQVIEAYFIKYFKNK